jgi:hypothetical protein
MRLRAFFTAQMQWERYRALRLALVHLLAASTLCFWLPIPGWVRLPMAAGCGACFLGALFTGMMEWRWGRERDRRAGTLGRPGESD